MKRVMRLTESDLRNIVRRSVGKIINEIGDTSKGQRALGALAQRHALRNPKYDARDNTSKEAKIYDYAKKARGGDTYDYKGTPQNPKYYDYANGAIDYMNSHTDELVAAHRRAGMGESRRRRNGVLREFGSDGPDWDEPYEYNDLDMDGVPSYTEHAQSASDFDTDEDLLGMDGSYNDFDDEGFDDESYDLSNIREFESRKRIGEIIRESINKVLNETEVYPGWDSTTTGDYGTQEEPSYMKPQGHESEEDERRRHERFLRKIYADYGLPNGLGKGNSDDVIVGNNELASKTDLVRAFARYFRNRFKDAPEGFKAYEILFKNYVKDPIKIYKWFERNGIDYKKYLEDADDSMVVRMKY